MRILVVEDEKEQRHKDINKACARTLYSLAKVLGCSMENLLEK